MAAKLGEGSKWTKIAALCLIITFILHLIAMGAAHWAKSNPRMTERSESIGLWRYCSYPIGGGQTCDEFVDMRVGDWLHAAQSFSILALFALLGAVAVVAIYAFVPDFSDDRRFLMISISVTGVAAIFQLIEVATMGVKFQEYFKNKDPMTWGEVGQLDWAFGVGAASLCLNFLTIVLLVLDMMRGDED